MNDKEREMKYRQDMDKAEKAKKLLESTMLQDYYKDTKDNILAQLGAGQLDADKERELLYFLKAVCYQERHFEKMLRDGMKAQTLLQKIIKGRQL